MEPRDFPTHLIVALCIVLLAHEMDAAERTTYCSSPPQMGCCTRNTRSTIDTDDQTWILRQHMCTFEKALHCADCSFTAQKASAMAWSTVPKYLRGVQCANRVGLEKRLEELYAFIRMLEPMNGEQNATLSKISEHVNSTLNTLPRRHKMRANRIEDEFNPTKKDNSSSTEVNRRVKVIFTVLGMIYERLHPHAKHQQEVLHSVCQGNRTLTHAKKTNMKINRHQENMYKIRHSGRLMCPGGHKNVAKMAECYCSLHKKMIKARESSKKKSSRPILKKLINSIKKIRFALTKYANDRNNGETISTKCQLKPKKQDCNNGNEDLVILCFFKKFTKLNDELRNSTNFAVIQDINPEKAPVRST